MFYLILTLLLIVAFAHIAVRSNATLLLFTLLTTGFIFYIDYGQKPLLQVCIISVAALSVTLIVGIAIKHFSKKLIKGNWEDVPKNMRTYKNLFFVIFIIAALAHGFLYGF